MPQYNLLLGVTLYGLGMGAVLTLALRIVIRRFRKNELAERRLLLLLSTLFIWNLSSFLAIVMRSNFALNQRWFFLKYPALLIDTIALFALVLIPSLLLNFHLVLQSNLLPKPIVRMNKWKEGLLFWPLLFLPAALPEFAESYKDIFGMQRVLGADLLAKPDFANFIFLSVPSWVPFFAFWFLAVLGCTIFIEWKLLPACRAVHERRFLKSLMVFFSMVAILAAATFLLNNHQEFIERFPPVGLMLNIWSLAPCLLLGYYLFQYNFKQAAIQRNVLYFFLGALLFPAYPALLRPIQDALWKEFYVPPEAINIASGFLILALAMPAKRVIDRMVDSLFSEAVARVQKLAVRLDEVSRSTSNLAQLFGFTEELIQKELGLPDVKIFLYPSPQDKPATTLIPYLDETKQVLGLLKENRVIGEIRIGRSMGNSLAGNLEALRLLSAQVVAAIENCQLAEEKIQLERMVAERENEAALGRMAQNVAHNIKNPLSSIKNIVQLMREDSGMATAYAQDLSYIIHEINRLTEYITKLLKYKPSVLTLMPVNLCKILNEVLRIFSADAQKRGIRLDLECPASGLMVQSDQEVLLDVIQNLVVNAMEAIPGEGAMVLKARLVSRGERQMAMVAVEDTGQGIPPEVMANIFKRFFTTKPKGTGLGLAIIQRGVLDLGGQVECFSPVADGRGTRFEISFPQMEERRKSPRL
jgi:signal transduction histidine kinase